MNDQQKSEQYSEVQDQEIRAALDQHWAASDANDFETEHRIYREDAVLASRRAKILNRPSEASVNGSLKALRRQVFYDGASTCATPSIAPDF